MKILKRIALVLGILIALVLIVSLFLPGDYKVERTGTVNAPPDSVVVLLADLKQWQKWSPWQQDDTTMKMTYSANTFGPGAWQKWESKKSGNGELTLVSVTPSEVRYTFSMQQGGMKSDGKISLLPEGNGTKVVWTMSGNVGMNPMGKYFALFMDKFVGPDFEKGIKNLDAAVKK